MYMPLTRPLDKKPEGWALFEQAHQVFLMGFRKLLLEGMFSHTILTERTTGIASL